MENEYGEKKKIFDPEKIHIYAVLKAVGRQVKKGEKSIAAFQRWKHTTKKPKKEDEEEEEIQVIKEDEYIVDGSIKITDVNELIGVRLESEEFDSIGGYIIGHLRRLPEENEVIEVDNIKFCIESLDKNRIKKVRIFT